MGGSNEWPSLDDVSLDLSSVVHRYYLPDELGVAVRLLCAVSAMMVNTYTGIDPDPGLDDDDKLLARIGMVPTRKCFTLLDGKWRLTDDGVIRISRRTSRAAIPTAVKAAAVARDGQRCSYCGDTAGPFHFDHLYPVSRGGADVPHNIVIACQPCNLSKGDKTILEWVEFLRGRD